ncbi:Organic cation transporter 1 [Halotydeus destructor]|nr:Organic cation transporter 1 [Halotydeus destructor]
MNLSLNAITVDPASAEISEDGSSAYQTRDPSPVREGSFSLVSPCTDFNILLDKVGSFGKFQLLILWLLVVPAAAFSAILYLNQYFILLTPDHHCQLPDKEDDVSKWLPRVSVHHGGEDTYSKCEIYSGDHLGINKSIAVQCSRYVYAFNQSDMFATFATDMNLVCKYDKYPSYIQTVFYLGTSLGCLLFGYIADTCGRKPSIVVSSTIAGVSGVLSAFTSDIRIFTFLRLVIGSTYLAFSEDPIVLALEYSSIDKRTLCIVFWVSGYIISSATFPWIAKYIANWRHLCIITSLPLLAFPLLYKYIPESASWLAAEKRTTEAHALLRLVAKTNGKTLPTVLSAQGSPMKLKLMPENGSVTQGLSPYSIPKELRKRKESVIMTQARKVGAFHIFLTPRLRIRSLLLGTVWFVTLGCYHTNILNLANLGNNIYLSFTLGAVVEFPSIVIVLLTLEKYGRRLPMVISTAVAGVCGLMSVLLDPEHHLVINLVMRICLAVEYNIIIQYSAEVYPTILRGRAISFFRLMGTFGLFATPTITYLATESPSLPFLVMGSMLTMVSIISMFLPETLGENLPHSYEEGENFGRGQKVFWFPPMATEV